MAVKLCYFVIFALFATTSVLAASKKCYSCFGVMAKECADLTEDDMNKNKTLYQTPCPTTREEVQIMIDQFSESAGNGDKAGIVLKTLAEKLSAVKADMDFDWACIKITFTHDLNEDAEFGLRSCWPDELLDRDGCEYAEHAVGLVAGDLDYCGTCSDDLCNSAVSISNFSMLTVVLVTLFKMLL